MKKLITITFTLLLVFGLSAQTDQGSMLLGANTSFNMATTSELSYTVDGDEPDGYESDKTTQTTTTAEVSFGYFVIDNLAVGVNLNYQAQKIDYNDSDWDNPDPLNTTTYGAFTRYYIGGVGFVGAGYGMSTSSAWDDLEDKPTVGVLTAEAGVSLFLSDNVAFTPRVLYSVVTTTEEYADTKYQSQTGIMNIGAGLNIHF